MYIYIYIYLFNKSTYIYIYIYIYVLDPGRDEAAVPGRSQAVDRESLESMEQSGEHGPRHVLPPYREHYRCHRSDLQMVEFEVDLAVEQLGSSSKDVRYFCQNLPCPVSVDL